jgi:hypothetical protein
MPWEERAACAGAVSELWDQALSPETAVYCRGCPVRVDCLNDALGREAKCDVGVWGGTGPAERVLIRSGRLSVAQAWAACARLGDRVVPA